MHSGGGLPIIRWVGASESAQCTHQMRPLVRCSEVPLSALMPLYMLVLLKMRVNSHTLSHVVQNVKECNQKYLPHHLVNALALPPLSASLSRHPGPLVLWASVFLCN